VVNVFDLSMMLASYNKTLSLTGTEVSIQEYSTLDGEAVGVLQAAGVTVVPEPGTLVLFGIGAMGVAVSLWRRRGQRSR
jgi:hypothetical protein